MRSFAIVILVLLFFPSALFLVFSLAPLAEVNIVNIADRPIEVAIVGYSSRSNDYGCLFTFLDRDDRWLGDWQKTLKIDP